MNNVLIFGTGSLAEMAHYYISMKQDARVIGFTADGAFIQSDKFCGLPVVPFEELSTHFPAAGHSVLVAVGYTGVNRIRQQKFEQIKKAGYRFYSYIHETSHVPDTIRLGENCLIFERNVFQPFSKIGDNVIMWTNNVVGHHVVVGNNCFISSHAVIGGYTVVGENCFVGMNSTLSDHISVGDRCIIGAGALVTEDSEPDGVYPGPASQRSKVPSHRLKI